MPREKKQNKKPQKSKGRESKKTRRPKEIQPKEAEAEIEAEAEKISKPKTIQNLEKEYAVDRRYDPPSEEICNFLKQTLPMLSSDFKLDRMKVAKELLDHGDPSWRARLTLLKITATFSYLYQAGILDHETQWNRSRGGYHFLLWRSADRCNIEKILSDKPTFLNGKAIEESSCIESSIETLTLTDCLNESTVSSESPKVQVGNSHKKRCCDNPHPVKNRQSGKRRCKNCGTKLKNNKHAN